MYSESRIREKIIREAGFDFDWYFVDGAGQLAIVSSAGGLLPDTVATNLEKQNKLQSYFRTLPDISDEIILSEEILKQIKSFDENRKSSFLKDLLFMSKKGLFYYDKLELNQYYDFRYYLKSRPSKALLVSDIDYSAADMVISTRIDEIFTATNLIHVDQIQ